MKTRLLLLANLWTLTTQVSTQEPTRATSQEPYLVYSINASNFRQAGATSLTATYTITNPGTYVLSENIYLTAGIDQAIIYINSNDVTFNLNGNTLSQSGSATGVDGIRINSSKTNITISNGVIRALSGSGIYVNASCNGVNLQDLFITQCQIAGANFVGGSGTEIINCTLTDCKISGCTGNSTNDAIGLKITYCDNLEVTNCTFNLHKNTNSERSSFGVYATNSQTASFTTCQANGSVGETSAAGFYLSTNCNGWTLTSCYALKNSATNTSSGTVYGFYINQSNFCVFDSCISGLNTAPIFTDGFRLSQSQYDIVKNCTSMRNTATLNSGNPQITGLHITGDTTNVGHYIVDSIFNGNAGTGSLGALACGILIAGGGFHRLFRCTVNANGCKAVGETRGILLRSPTFGILTTNCYIEQNSSTTSVGHYENQAAGGNNNTENNNTAGSNFIWP